MDIWEFMQDKLSSSQHLMLLYVLGSEGSSPGRNGFKMAVASDGSIFGTIGGGIMEHKLVEKARDMLQRKDLSVQLMRQYHNKVHTTDQSGMICSGNQLNAFLPIAAADIKTIEKITEGGPYIIQLSPDGLSIVEATPQDSNHHLQYQSEKKWIYKEKLNQRHVIHIIGGGHVSLALSELMCFLGFYSKVYDDRPELNTILQNYFANEKIIIPGYEQLG